MPTIEEMRALELRRLRQVYWFARGRRLRSRRKKAAVTYLLDHQFFTTAADTAAQPGPGTWVDVNNTLTVVGGKMVLNATNDIGYFDDAITRTAGQLAIARLDASADGDFDIINFGFDDAKTAVPDRNGIQLGATTTYNAIVDGSTFAIGSYSGLTAIQLITVLRSTGAYLYAHDGSNWQLLYVVATNSTATLFAGIGATTTAPTANVSEIRVPDTTTENLPDQAWDDFSAPTTVAVDSGSNGLDGAYLSVGLAGSNGVFCKSTGSATGVNIYSAAFNSAFDGSEFGAMLRAKVATVGEWTNGTEKTILRLRVDGNNQFAIVKRTTDTDLLVDYFGNATRVNVIIDTASPITFFGVGCRLSDDGDEFEVSYNGAQSGSTLTGIGSWAGNLDSTRTMIGASTNNGFSEFDGWVKDVVITLNGVVPTLVQLNWYTDTSNVITATQLNTDFGAGNWAWRPLTETHSTLAASPESKVIDQYAHTGKTPRISAGAMSVSPVIGAELASGNLVVGNWYEITASQVDHFYTGSAIADTFQAGATTALDANNKVKLIDLDSTIAALSYDQDDVWVSAPLTITDRTQAGLILRSSATSTLSGASYLHVYCNRIDGKIYVDQVAAGTPTNLTSFAFTYSAGTRLVAWLSGTSLRVYYNEAHLATVVVTDSGNTIHGAFATDSATSWSEIQVVPVEDATLGTQFDLYIP